MDKENLVPSLPIRRRLVPAALALVLGLGLVTGCGTGQGTASNYDELEDNFIEGCEAQVEADAESSEAAAELPDDFCRCAFDALSEGDDAVPFDELMDVNDDLAEDAGPLPESVTAAFAACSQPG